MWYVFSRNDAHVARKKTGNSWNMSCTDLSYFLNRPDSKWKRWCRAVLKAVRLFGIFFLLTNTSSILSMLSTNVRRANYLEHDCFTFQEQAGHYMYAWIVPHPLNYSVFAWPVPAIIFFLLKTGFSQLRGGFGTECSAKHNFLHVLFCSRSWSGHEHLKIAN